MLDAIDRIGKSVGGQDEKVSAHIGAQDSKVGYLATAVGALSATVGAQMGELRRTLDQHVEAVQKIRGRWNSQNAKSTEDLSAVLEQLRVDGIARD